MDGSQYRIKNNPGTVILHGQEKSVKGKGFIRDERNGDLLLQFHVISPPSLSLEQVAILEQVFSDKTDKVEASTVE